jgi:mRNA interferase RelE/StbE
VTRDVLRLEDNPRPHGVEKMETKEKLYRVYVGPGKNYRVIYEIRDEILLVLVVKVGDRKEVYRRVK